MGWGGGGGGGGGGGSSEGGESGNWGERVDAKM